MIYMEKGIKVGDIVRFDYNTTPRIYLIYSNISVGSICIVDDIQDGNAVVKYDDGEQIKTLVLPSKYLIKVGGEPKEPSRIFYGDYAKVASQSLEELKRKAHPEWFSITEPTEHTEAEEDARIRQKEAELEAFRKSELDRVLYPEKSHTYEVTVDNVAMDWQRYAADLAKEVVLKVANKFNGPKEAAEYAVKVTKAVVEGLKRE